MEPLEEIAIHTPTQKEYDTLMKVFEAGGWKWFSGELPTDSLKLLWKEYRDKCCVEAFNSFKYRDKKVFKENYYNIISPKQFYDREGVSPRNVKEIVGLHNCIKRLLAKRV